MLTVQHLAGGNCERREGPRAIADLGGIRAHL